jgi:streptogramin lyase
MMATWAAMATLAAAVGSGLISVTALPAQADTATIREYRVSSPNCFCPTDVTNGPDGNLWFTEPVGPPGNVGKMTPTGRVTEFPTQGAPSSITAGADGNLWFLEPTYNQPGIVGRIGRITPAGVLTEFSAPSIVSQAYLYGTITLGPDGNVWYTDRDSRVVGRITPTGQISEFTVPGGGPGPVGGPTVIAAGSDGNLWFGLAGEPVIARISPTFTNYTELALPPTGTFRTPGEVNGITAGPDGNIWYTNVVANKIGRVTPSGVFTEFPIPYSGSFPQDITTGPDGNLWFTEGIGNRVGRVTPTGHIREFLLPHDNENPTGITAGPDHKVWFAEQNFGSVGSIDPTTVKSPPKPCLTIRTNTTLTADVGPCAGEGIVVAANNVTLDLNGHRVFAGPGPRVGDFAGIHLRGAKGVTVTNGEVTGFDAGVFVDGGSGNIITHLKVHDNLGPPESASVLGDGIVLTHSAANIVANNDVGHNGPFDGIGVLGLGSDNNTIQADNVHGNTDRGLGYFLPGGGSGIIITSFLETEAIGRGESLSSNNVINNVVNNNISSGISSISNVGARIVGNHLKNNGFRPDGSPGSPQGNGIGVNANQGATPVTNDIVTDNAVDNSLNDGIFVISSGNQVARNRFTANAFVGIENDYFAHSNTYTTNVATGNGYYDLLDDNVYITNDCDANTWQDNTYGTAYPECTTTGGHPVGAPPAAFPAPVQPSVHAPPSQAAFEQFSRGRSLVNLSRTRAR